MGKPYSIDLRERVSPLTHLKKELVSDDNILKVYRWACQAESVYKLNPRRMAAFAIIFEELGLTHADAIRAMKNVEDPDDLKA
jgi:hypothetical protein